MRKRTLTVISAIMLVLNIAACKKSDDTTSTPNNNTNTPKPSYTDTIARNWVVKQATHNGQTDNSSTGLEVDIKKNGSYDLPSQPYTGTWEFAENYTKVLIDKNDATFKTTWTIVKMTSKYLEVNFKSPFTGGSAVWKMEPK